MSCDTLLVWGLIHGRGISHSGSVSLLLLSSESQMVDASRVGGKRGICGLVGDGYRT